jgi:hypothetical protein
LVLPKKTVTLENLEGLGARRLAELLLELGEEDAEIKRRLRLEPAGEAGATVPTMLLNSKGSPWPWTAGLVAMLNSEGIKGESRSPRVLLLSQRGVDHLAFSTALYQFENLIGELDDVDFLVPTLPAFKGNRRYRLALSLGLSKTAARTVAFFRKDFTINRDYDLFVAVLGAYRQVASIHTIRHLRSRCRKAVCYLAEVWPSNFKDENAIFDLYSIFDYVFIGLEHAVEPLERIIGCPCSYLPHGVDGLRSYPPPGAVRAIDIFNVGRRSEVTHRALREFADERDLFYYFGNIKHTDEEFQDHRYLLAALIKHSRYFIANYAKFDRPDQTDGVEEVSYRYFEGAIGGTVIIGRPPDSAAFRRLFSWPDAVIPSPIDNPAIGDLIASLEADPDRVNRIRAANVVHSLREHDWVYRYGAMLDAVGIPQSPQMALRRHRLATIGESVETEGLPSVPSRPVPPADWMPKR